jgi:hypothetical protein
MAPAIRGALLCCLVAALAWAAAGDASIGAAPAVMAMQGPSGGSTTRMVYLVRHGESAKNLITCADARGSATDAARWTRGGSARVF